MACSICGISLSFSTSCALKAAGGNHTQVRFINAQDVTAYTFDVTDTKKLLSVTLKAGKGWYTLDANEASVSATATYDRTRELFSQEVVAVIGRYSDATDAVKAAAEHSAFLDALARNKCGILMAVEDKLGVVRLYGYTRNASVRTGLMATPADASGTAATDVAGTTLTFAFESSLAPPAVADNFVWAAPTP